MGSFFDKVIDPLDAERLVLLSPLWLFLPWLLADHKQHEVREGVLRRGGLDGGRVRQGGRLDKSLLQEEEVGVVLLGLLVTAVAWVRDDVQTVRKE
jgi:hypothetical protein